MTKRNEVNATKTESLRTPTPWKVGGKDVNGLTRIRLDDETIGRIGKYQDAAFIVRAVNVHKELLKALYSARAQLDNDWGIGKSPVSKAIEQAIAKSNPGQGEL